MRYDATDRVGSHLYVVAVDSTDIIPKNIALSTQVIKQYNVMPVYGE